MGSKTGYSNRLTNENVLPELELPEQCSSVQLPSTLRFYRLIKYTWYHVMVQDIQQVNQNEEWSQLV